MKATEASTEKLIADLKIVAHDAEELLRAGAGEVGEKAREAQARLSDALESARASVRRLQQKTVAGVKATDRVVREHPYQSMGIAFGVGVLIGVLVMRR